MTEKIKTVIECYFLLPDFQFRGHPSLNGKSRILESRKKPEVINENIGKDLVCTEFNRQWPLKRHAFGKNDLLIFLQLVSFTGGLPEITVCQVLNLIFFVFLRNRHIIFRNSSFFYEIVNLNRAICWLTIWFHSVSVHFRLSPVIPAWYYQDHPCFPSFLGGSRPPRTDSNPDNPGFLSGWHQIFRKWFWRWPFDCWLFLNPVLRNQLRISS